MTSPCDTGYRYSDPAPNPSHSYLLPTLLREMSQLKNGNSGASRVFDLGCGNGSVAAILSREGWSVTGVDPSTEGIRQAKNSYPHLRLDQGSAYDDLAAKYGRFPVVISLEVVEHVYAPRDFARTLHDLVEPGGTAFISTPYHGYLKNLALAVSGRMDNHFKALWDHGHIKFWSVRTLGTLLTEAGFRDLRFLGVGRIPSLAKSMIAIARKPT